MHPSRAGHRHWSHAAEEGRCCLARCLPPTHTCQPRPLNRPASQPFMHPPPNRPASQLFMHPPTWKGVSSLMGSMSSVFTLCNGAA